MLKQKGVIDTSFFQKVFCENKYSQNCHGKPCQIYFMIFMFVLCNPICFEHIPKTRIILKASPTNFARIPRDSNETAKTQNEKSSRCPAQNNKRKSGLGFRVWGVGFVCGALRLPPGGPRAPTRRFVVLGLWRRFQRTCCRCCAKLSTKDVQPGHRPSCSSGGRRDVVSGNTEQMLVSLSKWYEAG